MKKEESFEEKLARSNGEERAYPDNERQCGFTKRELIAKDALVGILSMSTPPNISNEQALMAYLKFPSMLAVMQADALLLALATEPKDQA